jgi:signal peptidase I
MRLLRTSALFVLTGAFVTVGVLFWPANLGGRTTYVTTHGTSMIPRFHSGDLAIVQSAATYHVGEIAAYHSATLHTVVLHRIIAVHGGHFTFKGDNNNFTDPDHPTANLLVGRLVARVPHGGEYRGLLAKPIVLFPVLAFVFGGFVFGKEQSRRKRARRRARAPAPARPRSHERRLGQRGLAVLVVGALATSGAVLAAVAVWTASRTQTITTSEPYRANATIGYSGKAPRGAVYPDGHLHTGDPLFTRMIAQASVDLRFDFVTDATTRRSLRGTSQVVADMSSETGWHREFVLAPTRAFTGDRLTASATLDLRALQRAEHAFSVETGLSTPDATLLVTWNLHVGGEAATTPVRADLSPVLAFQITPVELLPSQSTSGTGGAASAVGPSATKTGSISVPVVRDRTFGLWGLRASGSLMRFLTVALAALLAASTAVALVLDRRRSMHSVADTLVYRYRYLLVKADAIPVAGRRPVVQVDTMRDLARLAKLHEELIVHAREGERHRFALFTEAVVYAYEVRPPARTEPGPDELAKWALAGLEACAAEHRRTGRAPVARHVRAGAPPRPPEPQYVDGPS